MKRKWDRNRGIGREKCVGRGLNATASTGNEGARWKAMMQLLVASFNNGVR